MKLLTMTTEHRAYTEDEAKDAINDFREKAKAEGYIVKSAGFTYKTKKSKGEIVGEAWIVKCVAIYNDIWEADE